MSRLSNTSTVGKVGLSNTDLDSGAFISNTQKAINTVFEAVGLTDESDPTLNDYDSNNYITDGDSRKVAIEKLDAQLGTTQTQLDAVDAANSQDVSVGAVGSTPNANGLTITGQVLNLEPADSTHGGAVTTGTQSFAGNKTFNNDVTVAGNFTVSGTTTTVSSATLDVTDTNITVNKSGSDISSEGAGLTVDRIGTKGSLVYANALTSKFKAGDLGSEIEIANVSSTQEFTNKTLTNPTVTTGNFTSPNITTPVVDIQTMTEQGSTPSTPASGKRKIYPKSDGFYDLDSAGIEKKIGTGSGGGGAKNFISNGDAETGTTGWTVDSFAAASRPSGALTGVSTGLTFTTTATNPLSDTNSFLITKDAVNRQGRVVYTGITLTSGYFAKVLEISAQYVVNSGTFVAGSSGIDSDIIFYLQNVTDGTFIEPSSFKLLSNSTTIPDVFSATFQTAAAATSYRLLMYVATTSEAAYVLKVDNISVSPSNYVYGSPVTDYQYYTPTTQGLGTPTSVDFKWRRIGQVMEIQGTLLAGTVTGSQLQIGLPSAYNISTTLSTGSEVVGSFTTNNITIASSSYVVLAAGNTSYIAVGAKLTTTTNQYNYQNANSVLATGNAITIHCFVPIIGWSSSVQMSDKTDTRVVAFRALSQLATGTITSTISVAKLGTVYKDTHGAYNTTTGVYTVPVSGFYSVNGTTNTTASSSALNNYTAASVLVNGATNAESFTSIQTATSTTLNASVSAIVYCDAGDTISLGCRSNQTSPVYSTGLSGTYLSINRISGPSAIAASESVNCRYTNTAGTSISNSGSDINVPFATKDYDSHGAYNTSTGIFTAPISGKYKISSYLTFASGVYAVGNSIDASVYKNGSVHSYGANITVQAATTQTIGTNINSTVNLLAGDTVEIRVYNSRTAGATALNTSAGYNHVEIERVGN